MGWSVRIGGSALVLGLALTLAGCGGGAAKSAESSPARARSEVFERVGASVVAVLNANEAEQREEETKALGVLTKEKAKAPKKIIDVSLRKDPIPDGTGFLIEGGMVLTAAHVVQAPRHLKLKTRAGQLVDAELVHIDEVRDVAVLKPKQPLQNVPPLTLGRAEDVKPGRTVWALGHTAGAGGGLWALSWGISEGIASGVVEQLGASLLVFDAPVFPGFSGGPVIALDADRKPVVIGVNQAILFAGSTISTISAAASIGDIRKAIAKEPPAIQKTLAEYAAKKRSEQRAELFVTAQLSVHRDPSALASAAIGGNSRVISIHEGHASVPVVAMVLGAPLGKNALRFELHDPNDKIVAKDERTLTLEHKERVGFASANFTVLPEFAGRYDIVVKLNDKVIGQTDVWLDDPSDDQQAIDDEDDDVDAEPKVDVVVAMLGSSDPLALYGIRAAWSEWRYPRRVGFTWFARGSRGWSGRNVAVSAFVLDPNGAIVGRGVGCIRPELRAEHTWDCMGSGGTPLVSSAGHYDIVFALNDRPVAMWPMEAIVREDQSPIQSWLHQLQNRPPTRVPDAPKPESRKPKH